jgi:hypothetical protein
LTATQNEEGLARIARTKLRISNKTKGTRPCILENFKALEMEFSDFKRCTKRNASENVSQFRRNHKQNKKNEE